MTELVQIERMAKKPVFYVPAKSVVNFDSGFKHKLLCDGLTFSAGSACVYSCTFCYVDDLMQKSPHTQNVRTQFADKFPGEPMPRHADVVIRRRDALNALRSTLAPRGKAKYLDDHRVLYMSPLVDVAANRELCDETIEACKIILELTCWHIRLLSKSNMLPRIAQALDKWWGGEEGYKPTDASYFKSPRARVIYGVSTGTLNDKLAKSFEQGTALPLKRIESLRWLQDNGYRTYGMICPSLPMPSSQYRNFSAEICEAIRVDKCEHVWAEVMNVRGESLIRTEAALRSGGYDMYADLLKMAAEDKSYWEEYSRLTFKAHAEFIPGNKLRFLQYVTKATKPWWLEQVQNGAVLL